MPDSQPKFMGILTDYVNMYGQQELISDQARQTILQAMAPPVAIESPLSAAYVLTQWQSGYVKLLQPGYFVWRLTLESGLAAGEGINQGQQLIQLPADLPLGYHHLTLYDHRQQWQCQIIVTPSQCYQPPALINGKKLWGISTQLYTLRSKTNWGIGDFSDLASLIGHIAERGGSFVGLNPLHTLYPANPQAASPYSPSSRNWLNIIYIDVTVVDEFIQSASAQAWYQQPDIQAKLADTRDNEWVDYRLVMELKLTGLKLAYHYFVCQTAENGRGESFAQFKHSSGQHLQQQALFDALAEVLGCQQGWQAWPDDYQDYNSLAVKKFQQQYAELINFYCWLQWLAQQQLQACYQLCDSLHMPLGLYCDLAVGDSAGGAESWQDQQLYRLGASIGAPPDPLGPLGQSWGLPPQDPNVLAQLAFQPFIELLRSNMRYCHALRLDHVMGLYRQWWVVANNSSTTGGYVKYPDDQLFAILALESQRHRCMVIGEDLGLVPDKVRYHTDSKQIYSYKVLYFEHDPQGHFIAPQDYPAKALATITTHDLPTLCGYWQLLDLKIGQQLGIYGDQQALNILITQRENNKQQLLEKLLESGCLIAEKPQLLLKQSFSWPLNQAIHHYIAMSQSQLLALQLEDWLMMAQPVNIPGTVEQYPNWRRKLSRSLEAIFADQNINTLINIVSRYR